MKPALRQMLAWLGPCLLLGTTVAAEAHRGDVPERAITASERAHWAYQPLAQQSPPEVSDEQWSRNPIDRFLHRALEQQTLQPMPPADKATWLRRVYFGLTGLPPTAAQVQSFLADESVDAHARVVDELLASPAYGERWAQHWLDLARFAETDGFEFDSVRPNAWRYRDWVIQALNDDMPFDTFVHLQLAGDLLQPDDPLASVATGFLLAGPDMPDLNLQEERRHLVLNEMAATVGAAFLGLQVGCAQCHDHKFDAITQHDFHRLRAFFESVDIFHDHPIPTADEAVARRAAEARWTPEHRQQQERRKALDDAARRRLKEKNPDARPTADALLVELSDAERDEYQSLAAVLDALPALPGLPAGRVVREGEAHTSYLYHRGDFRQAGPELTPGYLKVIEITDDTQPPRSRSDLAQWLTRADHPLTARVIVNRLWQWHFGQGLVASTSDFGVMGDEPTHPDLLDWLAGYLMESGWSLKALHRLIVTSAAYRMASAPYDSAWDEQQLEVALDVWQASSAVDPDNQWWWRRRAVRQEGESLRDAMLLATDALSTRRGGPGIRPPLPPAVTQTLLKDQWNVNGDEEDHRRRSVYLFVRRNARFPLFEVFDRPDALASCARRHESTTATQSLMLFNSQFSLERATALAGLLIDAAPGDAERQIEWAYLRVLSRSPAAMEIERAKAFLQAQSSRLRDDARTPESLASLRAESNADPYQAATLIDLCLALFNSNEFLWID